MHEAQLSHHSYAIIGHTQELKDDVNIKTINFEKYTEHTTALLITFLLRNVTASNKLLHTSTD